MRHPCAVAALMVVCLAGLAGAGLQAAEGAADSMKIGVFDPQRVFEDSNLGKKMRQDMDALAQKKRSELQLKEDELKALQEKFKKEEPSLSEDKRGERERILQQKGIELKRLRDDASREVNSQVSDVESRFQKQVLTVIEKLGRDEGYTLIFDRAALAFSSPQADVTQHIIDRLNASQTTAAAKP